MRTEQAARAVDAVHPALRLCGSIALAVVGTLMVGSRWLSHLAIPALRLYIGDLLVAGVFFSTLGAVALSRGLIPRTGRRLLLPVLTLVAISIIRLSADFHSGLVALRDFAPFGYLILAVVAAITAPLIRPTRVVRILLIALHVHATWVALSNFTEVESALPAIGGVRILEVRSDFDGALVGVLAAWCLFRFATSRRKAPLLVGAAYVALVVVMASRAAVIATLFTVGLALLRALPELGGRHSPARPRTVTIGIVTLIALAMLSVTTAGGGNRLLTTAEPTLQLPSYTDPSGTTRARIYAWWKTTSYLAEEPSRAVLGVGFGENFLAASGGFSAFGPPEVGVRSPHNVLITVWGRLGLPGLATFLWLIIAVITQLRLRIGTPLPESVILAEMIFVSLLVVALFGVVFESPFGAITAAWSLGYGFVQEPFRIRTPR